jgi:transposase
LPLHLTWKEWSNILPWFLRCLPVAAIAQKTRVHRQRILRVLTYLRNSFQKSTLDIFSGTVEVDETYIGGQWKNKKHSAKAGGSKRGRGTSKTPVFGILSRGGKVWTQVVNDVEAKTLLSLISKWVELGSTICSDTWESYTGVTANGYVHQW